MYSFLNDYSEGAHERILEALTRVNREQDAPYGLDAHCENARRLIAAETGGGAERVHFLVGGTQANLCLIAAALRPHQGVIAAESGHISTHEAGAIEAAG
ncbi:MAG: beta-eliminating lyase-related protein, partial [Clostridia bacterium]|nr:beta-eliminating lyase-related protein [Clostridia bacterium]